MNLTPKGLSTPDYRTLGPFWAPKPSQVRTLGPVEYSDPGLSPELQVKLQRRRGDASSLVLFDGSPKRIYRPVSGPSLNNSY